MDTISSQYDFKTSSTFSVNKNNHLQNYVETWENFFDLYNHPFIHKTNNNEI